MELLKRSLEQRGIGTRLKSTTRLVVPGLDEGHVDLIIDHEVSFFTIHFGQFGHAHFDGQPENSKDIEAVSDFVQEVVSDRIIFVIYFQGSSKVGWGYFSYEPNKPPSPPSVGFVSGLWGRIRTAFGGTGKETKAYIWSGPVPGYKPPILNADNNGMATSGFASALSVQTAEELVEIMEARYGRGDIDT